MAEPLGRAETLSLLDRHGIRLRKELGQHFLVEPNVVRRIVEIAGVKPGSQVVEIGAGAGTLTRGLVAAGARVIAFEIDEALRPVLEETVGETAEVWFMDAAQVDFEALLPHGEWTVVANLPYNVGTPIVLDLLRKVPRVNRFVVMLQREAVDRLAASPGTKVYGLPSVIIGLHSRVQVVMSVAAHLFVPVPQVESAVAVIERTPADPSAERAILLAAAAFGQRRKMIRSALRAVLDDPGRVITNAGLSPTDRAEDLASSDWLRLAGAT